VHKHGLCTITCAVENICNIRNSVIGKFMRTLILSFDGYNIQHSIFEDVSIYFRIELF
jgi:hypothetical protein